MSLNDLKVRNAKPKEKFYKLTDGDGLYLHVTENGGKLWRFRYRFGGKEKLLALGAYPEITLLDARQRRDEARRQLAHGIDPSAVRKAQKQSNIQETETFEVIARKWHGRFTPTWTVGHAGTIMDRMERDIFPWIGNRPVAGIKAPEILATMRRVESREALETAHRIRTTCGQVFRYAVATGRADHDPSSDLKGALPHPQEKHRAAITEPVEVGKLKRAIDDYSGSFVVKCALKIAPYYFSGIGQWADKRKEPLSRNSI